MLVAASRPGHVPDRTCRPEPRARGREGVKASPDPPPRGGSHVTLVCSQLDAPVRGAVGRLGNGSSSLKGQPCTYYVLPTLIVVGSRTGTDAQAP